MKKLTIIFLGAFSTILTLTACGGKDMDGTPDESNSGPDYRNEKEPYHRQDTASTKKND